MRKRPRLGRLPDGVNRGRSGDPQHPCARLPDRLDALPYMTPAMLQNLRRAGVHCPADLRGRTGDQLYAALQTSYGEQPQHSVLYVLRAIAHFVRTGERKDWREFVDLGHKPRSQGGYGGRSRGGPGPHQPRHPRRPPSGARY